MTEYFDNAAADYDSIFTNSAIGQLQRNRVYFWLNHIQFFQSVQSVFELNCGTGYDAQIFHDKGLMVTATDVSSKMIETAKAKRSTEITFYPLNFKNIDSVDLKEEAVFSNFGGLNCASRHDLIDMVDVLSNKQQSGDKLVWVIMPKFSAVESIYFLFKFKWKAVFRRHTDKALLVNVDGVKVPTYFHSPKTIKKILEPNYNIKLVKPIALFLPPSYLEPFITKYPAFLKILHKLEKIFGRFSTFAGWSDHYIIVGERK